MWVWNRFPRARRPKLRIGLDCSSAATTDGTGIAYYIRNLVAQYATTTPATEEYVVCWRLSRHRQHHALVENLPKRVRRAVWQSPLYPVGAGRFDVFHGLDVRVPAWRKPPLVATIHDIFSVVADDFAKRKFRKKKIASYKRTLDRATAVICDSASTARDLREHLDAPEEKLVVVPLGVDSAYRPEAAEDIDRVREDFPIPEHYVLFVGRLDRRKNVARLVHAFAQAAPDLRPDLHLVLVGSGGFGSEEAMQAIEKSPLRERIVHIERLSPQYLPPVYAASSGLVFPTLYEGFGLPILEAMASGCPTLIGNAGSSPEVGGETALAVDPTDVDAIAAGLYRLMTDEAWRIAAVQTGLARAADYTWSRTANNTRRVYHRVLAGEPVAGKPLHAADA